ncbi:MAG: hypothetical protein H6R14_1430 [Proteobacteria bacterium]|nr:hypothetical protein [Pseudomonadota bacterium]
MANNQLNPSPITGFMRRFSLNFPHPLARKKETQTTTVPHLNISDFSRPDVSEIYVQEEEVCPLVEAEVYLMYGRKRDAEDVLKAGLKAGRITQDEISQFWANQRS